MNQMASSAVRLGFEHYSAMNDGFHWFQRMSRFSGMEGTVERKWNRTEERWNSGMVGDKLGIRH